MGGNGFRILMERIAEKGFNGGVVLRVTVVVMEVVKRGDEAEKTRTHPGLIGLLWR